jgi:hypothetical protein
VKQSSYSVLSLDCFVADAPRNDVAVAQVPLSGGLRQLRGEAESHPKRTLAMLAGRNDDVGRQGAGDARVLFARFLVWA